MLLSALTTTAAHLFTLTPTISLLSAARPLVELYVIDKIMVSRYLLATGRHFPAFCFAPSFAVALWYFRGSAVLGCISFLEDNYS